MEVVLPGDEVSTTAQLPAGATLRIGQGVRRDGTDLLATKAGVKRTHNNNTFWLETSQRRVRMPPCPIAMLMMPASVCCRAGGARHRHGDGSRR